MRIIYFDLDCLRADHVGCYGYHRETTPNIDKVAENGTIFTSCYTSNSPCLPSRAALFSGRFGINNGVVGHYPPEDTFRYPGVSHTHFTKSPMFMRYLRMNGMKTVSFSNFADRHTAWWFHAGFSEFHTVSLKQGQETADEVNAELIPWFKEHAKDENYFLHVHYWDIHAYYRAPEMQKWIDMFKDTPAPDFPDEKTIQKHYNEVYGPRTAHDLYTGYENEDTRPFPWMPDKVSNRDEFRMLIDGYDASIRYADFHLGQVIKVLKEQGLYEDTVIIISCDHGDSFGENGHYMDHSLANEPVHRLPLIIKWPGAKQGSKCSEFVYQLDLAPTVCEMMGFQTPDGWDGESFAPALKDKKFKGREYLVFDHGIYSFQRSLRTRDFMLTRTYHPGLYPIDDPVQLFDMKNDPHQTKNAASEFPKKVKELETMLTEWWHEQLPKHTPHPDPLEVAAGHGAFLYYKPEQMIERLKKTGRSKRIPELLARLKKYGTEVNP